MKDFELPTNIRQIGSIGDGLRIYVEDYVCTYLKQIADSDGRREKIAYLVGKHMVADSQETVFISGVIQGKYSEYFDGIEQFTDKSNQYADEMLATYFDGYEIVGWMQSQPGYGTDLNPAYADYHMENFTKHYQVIFVMDPAERLNAFYAWDDKMSGIYESKGYIVYYNKNAGMQDYMLDNKITSVKTNIKKTSVKPAKTEKIAETEKEAAIIPNKKTARYTPSSRTFASEKVTMEYKRVVNMLVSLSAVLFIICFIMGAGLIQSDGRISQLEKDVASLDTTSNYLVSQVKQIGTQAVFANQDEQSSEIEAQATQAPLIVPTPTPTMTPQTSPAPTPADVTPTPTLTPTPTPTPSPTPTPTPTPASTPTPEPADQQEYQTYTVQEGDSLYYISTKFFGTVDRVNEIMEINEITDPDTIYYGKVLKLPLE